MSDAISSKNRSLQQRAMSYLSELQNTGTYDPCVLYGLVREMLDANWHLEPAHETEAECTCPVVTSNHDVACPRYEPKSPRCHCGKFEWAPNTTRITDANGYEHYREACAGCFTEKTSVTTEENP